MTHRGGEIKGIIPSINMHASPIQPIQTEIEMLVDTKLKLKVYVGYHVQAAQNKDTTNLFLVSTSNFLSR